ncbi:MAG: AAA family ATPase [Prevotella sp.]|nr:AAA family ATPase [Prevotella sp.]
MSEGYEPYRVSAEELFAQIGELLDLLLQSGDVFMPQHTLHRVLVITCHEGIRDTNQAYGNLFSQVDYLCKKHHIAVKDRIAIQTMRRHSNHREPLSHEDLMYDIRALALFISAVFETSIPHAVATRIPHSNKPYDPIYSPYYDYLRGVVETWDEESITVTIEQGNHSDTLFIDYTADHLRYLKDILQEGMQLNMLGVRKKEGADRWEPALIIVEPDFLIDISSIARCFESYGHHPLNYTLHRMEPSALSQAILLGHFAGKALDDAVNNGESRVNTTIMNSFKQKAMEFCTCPDFQSEQFMSDAHTQAANIQQAVSTLFEHTDKRKALLEPTFICERLGITGRVDLMTTDFQLLVEQKSGRNWFVETGRPDEHGSMMPEPNYVQLLLYYGVLRYNFHLGFDHVDMRLLYSKYPPDKGLVVVNYLQSLFREAIQLRNLIVAWDLHVARHGFESILEWIRPETVNVKNLRDRFFLSWKLPALQAVCQPLREMSNLERAYYCTMMTFVYREQRVARLGAQEGVSTCSSDLWNMPLTEKVETGNIYTRLTLIHKEKSAEYNGYDTLTLHVPVQGDDFLPNFRTGDMIFLYAYQEGTEPDVRKSILFKGTLQRILTDEVTVILADGQQNPDLFVIPSPSTSSSSFYAIEHAPSDTSTTAIRSLHTFISAPKERKDLLLGQRVPRVDHSLSLSRSYHLHYDEIVLQAKQAQDCYLLVGPPGTGKTSMALRFLVDEALQESSSLLLTAYTNRAVDEICSMLVEAGKDFIRIGSPHRCDPRFHPYLIGNLIESCPRLDTMSERIRQTPILVGTTTTLSSHPEIFNLKHFSLAIVDEASQILEPDIIGLLSAHQGDQCCIDKFILIGDHKQLPAVVQQSEHDSEVSDPMLRTIGLTNCRHSLFERLSTLFAAYPVKGVLHRQGRMHPAIADFPCRMFYPHEHIEPVPLPHQQEEAHANVRFIPSRYCHHPGLSDKVNTDEARIVAEELQKIYEQYGNDFSAHTTVGVIVPYRNQIAVIRKEIEQLQIPSLLEISIDTVERYQGSQRDVIIYSFTIQHPYQLEFLTSNTFVESDADGSSRLIDRKLNVAITRARRLLILTGNPQVLAVNPLFRQLMAEATSP